MQLTRICILTLSFLASGMLWAATQKCPTEETDVPVTIAGTLEYHPGVYAWYGVSPVQSICGQKVIQLGFEDGAAFREAHRFIGCKVIAVGNLFVPDTGYWSAPMGITNAHIHQDQTCKQGGPLPDYSAIPIPSTVQRYRVTANYNPKTLNFSAQARDAASGKSLSPWQTYATDVGNGARDLQRMYCAEGFLASDPKDAFAQPDLQAAVDSDFPQAIDVVLPNNSSVQVSFLCTRSARTKKE